MTKKQSNWHYARPKLAQKYLNLFRLGLLSSRCLFARRRMGKTEFLKNDFLPVAKNEGYAVASVNLWDSQVDPARAIVSEFCKTIAQKKASKIQGKIIR